MIEIREPVSCLPFSDSCAMSNSPSQNGNTQKTKWKSKVVILWDIYWSHFTLCIHWIPAFSLTNHQKNFDSDNSFLWPSFWWKSLIVTTGLNKEIKTSIVHLLIWILHFLYLHTRNKKDSIFVNGGWLSFRAEILSTQKEGKLSFIH